MNVDKVRELVENTNIIIDVREIYEFDPSVFVDDMETAVDEDIAYRYHFIDMYGYIQKLLGKNEESNFEVVKDEQGKLHYTYFTTGPNDTTELAQRMLNLKNSIEDEDCTLLYLMPPDKYIEGYTTFATGIITGNTGIERI